MIKPLLLRLCVLDSVLLGVGCSGGCIVALRHELLVVLFVHRLIVTGRRLRRCHSASKVEPTMVIGIANLAG